MRRASGLWRRRARKMATMQGRGRQAAHKTTEEKEKEEAVKEVKAAAKGEKHG